MDILVLRNTGTQTVLPGESVNLGQVYRRFVNGCMPFTTTDTSITVAKRGVYNVDIVATLSSTVAGEAVLQLEQNAEALPSAIITETLVVGNFNTVPLQTTILVDITNVLGCNTVNPATLVLRNTGDNPITITNIDTRIVKEV